MTREEARAAIKVMEAYANGKKIQRTDLDGNWFDCENPNFDWASFNYRIKPEPKYRPFRTQEECWNEMLKHQPFGYLRNKRNGGIVHITGLNTVHYGELHIDLSINPHSFYTMDCLFEVYTFTDGAPFGVKEE